MTAGGVRPFQLEKGRSSQLGARQFLAGGRAREPVEKLRSERRVVRAGESITEKNGLAPPGIAKPRRQAVQRFLPRFGEPARGQNS